MDYNKLTRLSESLGTLKVGGSLHLSNNELARLPESFGKLTVGGDLRLYDNQWTTLPESFGSLVVGGDLYLNGPPPQRSISLHMLSRNLDWQDKSVDALPEI